MHKQPSATEIRCHIDEIFTGCDVVVPPITFDACDGIALVQASSVRG